MLKGKVPPDIRLQAFYTWISFPKHLIIPLGPFRKFTEIFAAEGASPVSLTPVANGKNLQSEKF